MKTNLHQILVLTLFGAFLPAMAGAQTATAEPRTALIIGVSAYDDTYFAPLQSPRLDAEKMERQLKTLGFEVQTLKDSRRRQIVEAIDTFGDQLTKRGGVGLFYYSGHGVQFDQQNFIVPKDTNIKTTKDLPEEAVAVQRVLNRMTDAKNRLNLVFLDACRNNAIPSESKGSGNGLASMRGGSGLMVFFATQPGQVAFDGTEGSGSLFTTALLNHLPARGVSLMDMMADVTAETETLSEKISDRRERQTPFVSGSLSGRFYFVPGDGSSLPPPVVRAAPVEDSPPPAPGSRVPATDIFHDSPYAAYNDFSREMILRRVQTKLYANGYYLGVIDGKSGPALKEALAEYQRTFNLSAHGWLDASTLENMKLDGIKEQSAAGTARASTDDPPPRIKPKVSPSANTRPRVTPTPANTPPPPAATAEDLDAKFKRAAEQFEKKK